MSVTVAERTRGKNAQPASIAWASASVENVPLIRGPVPGPKSIALQKRCAEREFGLFTWVEKIPVGFSHGEGLMLEDVDGNRYIDLTHGHMGAALGHGNPEVAEAVGRQFGKLSHLRNNPTEIRAELMDKLASIMPEDLNLFAFYSSGTESTEAAMRVARAVTGGHEFVSFYGDYHGRTLGATATSFGNIMTGPRLGGFVTVPNAYCHRCEFGLEPSTCKLHCVGFIERAIRTNSHGALAGIIVEPVTNGSGARVFPPGYLKGLREIADRTGALLIFDEHASGLGRTGTMWAGDREGVVPDVIFFGKYLGNGYPITVVASRERYRKKLAMEGQSSTHGGQPAACAAALKVIEILQRDNLAENAGRAGATVLEFMKGVAKRHPIVGVAQGIGYQLAYEFVDPRTGELSHDIADRVYVASIERGVCPSLVSHTIRVSPMMVASEAVAMKAHGIIEDAIAHVESQL
jgi:4-aminobutyrate aminotransferase/4-aminobutyrate aminotransferase/(S)-3-amino-2-methylpropionate transaminase